MYLPCESQSVLVGRASYLKRARISKALWAGQKAVKTTTPGWLARLAAVLLSERDLVSRAPEDICNFCEVPSGRHR
jgi:hypothetical protein